MPPRISLHELYGLQNKKKMIRVKSFHAVLERCHTRIRNVAAQGGMCCFYEVPGLIVGMPLYNLDECIDFIVNTMRKDGFLIQILPPPHVGVIYISWNPQELKPKRPALRHESRTSEAPPTPMPMPITNRLLGR